jgi:hypothetical protein
VIQQLASAAPGVAKASYAGLAAKFAETDCRFMQRRERLDARKTPRLVAVDIAVI